MRIALPRVVTDNQRKLRPSLPLRPTAMLRHTFALFSMLSLAACVSAAAPQAASTPAPSVQNKTITEHSITLALGERTTLSDGSQLAYLRLINDSRCPPNTQCVWAGDAEIELRWTPLNKGKATTFSLHTSPRQGDGAITLGNLRLTLSSLARGIAPKATLQISTVTN